MTISIANETYKGISNLTITSLDTGLVMAWTKPMDFVLNTNNQMKEQMSRNEQGEMARIGAYKTQSTPELQINYSVMQPELFSFSQGVYLISGSFATHLPKFIDTVKASYPAVVGTDLLGNGVTADPVDAKAAVRRDGISIALTRQPFTTFAPATPNSYAIGANMALKFSTDLVTEGASVALSVPYEGLVSNKLSENLITACRVDATMVNSRGRVTFFTAYAAIPNVQGTNFQPGSEQMSIGMYLLTPSDRCSAWEILETTKVVAC